MNNPNQLCWICGDVANSREHGVKKSTLKTVFREPSQKRPHRFHTNAARNQRIGGLNNRRLKFEPSICSYCNNTRTQPFDNAWHELFEYIYHREPRVQVGSKIRGCKVFPTHASKQLLNTHLYFAKVLGCNLVEGGVSVDTKPLADGIMNLHHVPNLYLQFGLIRDRPNIKAVGVSEIHSEDDVNGQSLALVQLHDFSRFAVTTIYIRDTVHYHPGAGSWHPKSGSNRIVFGDL